MKGVVLRRLRKDRVRIMRVAVWWLFECVFDSEGLSEFKNDGKAIGRRFCGWPNDSLQPEAAMETWRLFYISNF
jgi:hypothetical protein